MSEDRLSFLSNQLEEETTPVAEAVEQVAADTPQPAAEPEPKPETGQTRDEKGRFAPGSKGEITPEAPPASDQKDRAVPLTAMLDERDRRKAAEAEAARYRQQIAEMQRRSQPSQIPDVVENPQGYQQYIASQNAAALDRQEAQFSEDIARMKYGDEAVNSALEVATRAGVTDHFRSGPDRWSRMVQWHQAQATLQEVGNPADYRERIRAEERAKLEAEFAAKYTPAPPPVPPTSLAAAPSQGAQTTVPMGDQEAFSNAFRRRSTR